MSKANLVSVVARLGYSSLKAMQERVVVSILEGSDVFAVLATGYGKSLCFVCLPRAFDAALSGDSSCSLPSIVVVVSPLKSLLEDQV